VKKTEQKYSQTFSPKPEVEVVMYKGRGIKIAETIQDMAIVTMEDD